MHTCAHTGPHPLSWHIGLAGAQAAALGDAGLAAGMLRGMRRYQDWPRPPPLRPPPEVWAAHGARLLFYAPSAPGPALLCLPSLINRYTILDLAPGRSLARFLAARGVATYVLDWGDLAARPATRAATIADLIEAIAAPAIAAAAAHAGPRRPLAAAGHCMGGTLLMDAASRPRIARHLAALAFIAAPWDFHAGTAALRARAAAFAPAAAALAASDAGCVPTIGLQALFATVDPEMTARKFARFAAMGAGDPAAALFVAVEDWLNDGRALPGPVAREVMARWYGANAPAGAPEGWGKPALVIASSKDRLVPHGCAAALAQRLPNAHVIDPACGHISMIAGSGAIGSVWGPLLDWARGDLAA